MAICQLVLTLRFLKEESDLSLTTALVSLTYKSDISPLLLPTIQNTFKVQSCLSEVFPSLF